MDRLSVFVCVGSSSCGAVDMYNTLYPVLHTSTYEEIEPLDN